MKNILLAIVLLFLITSPDNKILIGYIKNKLPNNTVIVEGYDINQTLRIEEYRLEDFQYSFTHVGDIINMEKVR